VRQDRRDATATAGHLRSFAAGLEEAGALASAGSDVIESIGTIARWLGPVGRVC
jgi:hypothetical protein